MITIKTNTYWETEINALHGVMVKARAEFLRQYCVGQGCYECVVRHLCYDLDRSTDFTGVLFRGEKQ